MPKFDRGKSLAAVSLLAVVLSGCKGQESSGGTAGSRGASAGKDLYQARCAYCHGATGKGDTSMAGGNPTANLADGVWTYGSSVQQISRTISQGVPDTAMRGFNNVMAPGEIAQVALYVKSFEPPTP